MDHALGHLVSGIILGWFCPGYWITRWVKKEFLGDKEQKK
jgi:hypothetical protein